MGAGIARLASVKNGLTVGGVFARRAEREGLDLGSAIGLGREFGVSIGTDLRNVVRTCQPDMAIQATCSTLEDASSELSLLIDSGIPVISIAEEMAFPASLSETWAQNIDRKAKQRGVAVLGTGINPGFVLDTLVVALSGVCADVTAITATRINDLSPYGETVLKSQGVGLTPEAFHRGVADGSVVGHVGFPQSIHMIAEALGWTIDRIDETRAPIVAEIPLVTEVVTVAPGQVAGCRHTAVAYAGDRPLITLIHPQQICPEAAGIATGDSIEIKGTPHIRLSGSPEIPGGIGTQAIAVNMIPAVLNAAPGLHVMTDLPVPAAQLGDMRRCLREQTPTPAKKGDWVEIHRIVLPAGDRAPQVPEDTQGVPLEMRAKGFLTDAAALGEEVDIVTVTGRRMRGVLCTVNPSYDHGFGAPPPALAAIGGEVRALLEEAERSDDPSP